MTANIALLNDGGMIIAVNEPWRRFSDENGGSLGNHGLGLNYLGMLERAAQKPVPSHPKLAEDHRISKAVARGIRAVMSGAQDRFQIEYPCHSPKEERWFLLTVSPFATDSDARVIVAHENISKLVQAQKLAISHGLRLAAGFQAMIGAIGLAIEKRDPYTAGHQRQVAALSVEIGRVLGMTDEMLFGLNLGASVHDIGKISVPADILSKPGRLNVPERMLIQEHSAEGHDILRGVDFPWPIADMVLQHHERWDGSGYPQQMAGTDICLGARVIAVADTFDAITSHRPYRPGRPREVAIQELLNGRGTFFDPDVVDAAMTFLEAVDQSWFDQRRNAPPPPPPLDFP